MKFNLKLLWAVIPLAIVGGILYYFSEIVTYILMAWVISMIGAPIFVFLRKYLGKNLAAIVTLSLFVIGFLLLVWIFIPPLVNQVDNLAKVDYDRVVTALEEPIRDWEKWLVKKKLMIEPDSIQTTKPEDSLKIQNTNEIVTVDSIILLEDSIPGKKININITMNNRFLAEEGNRDKDENAEEGFFEMLKRNITLYLNPQKIQDIFSSAVSAFGDIMVGVFSIFFIGFFFLREQGLFDNILTSMVPTQYEMQTRQAVDETSKLLIRYFVGILIQVTLITVIISTLLAIIGVNNALLIGFFAGIMNIIPYIGPIIAAVVGVVITLSSNMELSFYGEMVPLLTKVIIVFIFTRLIDDVILQPNIFSKSVKAHPLEIFIIVLAGAKIAGILGMVLAIPFYTAFRVIGKVFLSEFKVIQRLTRNL